MSHTFDVGAFITRLQRLFLIVLLSLSENLFGGVPVVAPTMTEVSG